jgi:hypothetical protein
LKNVISHSDHSFWQELALTQKHGHKIIDENKATAILERSHMLDSVVNSDLIILEVDEIDTAEEIQNQGISDLDKVSVNHLI